MAFNLNFESAKKRTKTSYIPAILTLIILFYFVFTAAGQQTEEEHNGTKFFLYKPPSYSPAGSPSPLLVCLHGVAEIGDDLNLMLQNNSPRSPAFLIDRNQWPASRPFVVLSPQMKRDLSVPEINDQEWPPALIDDVLEHVLATYNVDESRVYITGLSTGGHGAWDYTEAFPEKIAALMPISGKTDTTAACLFKDIPIWVLHGGSDNLITSQFPIRMVAKINECQPQGAYKPHLTLMDAKRHEGWNDIYSYTSGYNIFEWVQQFTKNDLTNTPPYVNAGIDLKILQQDGSIYLHADIFDSDGTITNIQWTKISGGSLQLDDTDTEFLKVTDLQVGTFVFEVQATDNDGAQNSDQVELQIVSSAQPTDPAVTEFILINGTTNQDIGTLYDGQIINKNTLGINDINIRATPNNSSVVKSVRFKINSNHNTRQLNSPGPYLISPLITNNTEWVVVPGEYSICATAYSATGANGPGISKCVKISVYNQPVKVFYAKPGSEISNPNSWGTNPDGTGTPPASFTDHFQTFNITTSTMLTNPLEVGGVESSFWVRNGAMLNISDDFTGTLNIEANASVVVNTNQPVTFGTLDPASTIEFGLNATNIPGEEYGNLIISGVGSTKTLDPDTTAIAGDLTIEDNVTVNGAADGTSVLAVTGNISINENASFAPTERFSIFLESGSMQSVNFQGSLIELNHLNIAPNTTAEILSPVQSVTVELGLLNGGGLTVQNNSILNLSDANLLLTDNASLNGSGETGQLGFQNGSLTLNSGTSENSHLYLVEGADSLNALNVNMNNGGILSIENSVFVTDSIKCSNGTINSNGNLILVSTANKTARVAEIEGNGSIEGDVQFQRFTEGSTLYKYISVPVSGVPVSDLQNFLPVTGNFSGASSGTSNPSLYSYEEDGIGWTPFPALLNSEEFAIGTGYSLYLWKDFEEQAISLIGEIHQGDFSFSLNPDPDLLFEDDGWNLIGNPYAAPIQWSGDGWQTSGVHSAAYVRDNIFPGGRFLVWDGDTGDEEFSGLIAQGQSFWVQAISVNPALTVQESAKHNGDATMFRTKEDETVSRLVMELKHNELIDRTYLKFTEDVTDNFDRHLDAFKRKNGYFNLSTLSADSIHLAINNVSLEFCEKTVSLSISETVPGPYSLTFRGSVFENGNKAISLVDSYADSTIKIEDNGLYNFHVTEDFHSYGNSRFRLEIKTKLDDPVITAENNLLISNFKSGNQWMLNGTDIQGATDPVYEPVVSGEYQLRVVENGCAKFSAMLSFIVTNVFEQIKKNEIQIYPIPTSRFLNIRGLNKDTSVSKYTITSMAGTVIQQGEIKFEDSPQRDYTIELPESLPRGLYILKIESSSPRAFKFNLK